MEIKVNKEIRAYKENIFFGLSMRQFFCAIAAVGVAVLVYFGTKDVMHKEITSWLCILCAAPIAAAGFITYHGLTLEKFILAFIRSEFIYQRRLYFRALNIYKEATKEYYLKHKTIIQTKEQEVNPEINVKTSTELFGRSIDSYDSVSHNAKLVYAALLNDSVNNKTAMSYRDITSKSGLNKRDVKAAVRELDMAGLVIPRKGGFHLIEQ